VWFKARNIEVDGSAMDGFNFGKPVRGSVLDGRTLMILGGIVLVAAVVVVSFLQFVSRSGHEVADAQATVVGQIDRAQDVQAETTARTAESAAAVAYSESGSFADAGPGQLSAFDPSVSYTEGPSTGPTVVSVAATASAWSAAVLSPSGTCFWIKLDQTMAAHYGTGTTCTGAAAMAAAGPHW
jgi:hypothetical protein